MLGIVGILCLFAFLVSFLDAEKLQEWVVRSGVWAPVTFVLLKTTTIVVAPISGALLYPLVGLLFGFWEGMIYVGIGDFLGYSIAFFIGRMFGEKIVGHLVTQEGTGLLSRIVAHMSTTKGFLQMCLTFFYAPELLAYGAGLSRLPYWKFILILWPGSIAGTSLLVAFGSSFNLTQTDSLFITFGMPILGGILMLTGGWFFIRSLKQRE